MQSTVAAGAILAQRRRIRLRSKPKLRLRRAPGESTMQTSEVTEANANGPTVGETRDPVPGQWWLRNELRRLQAGAL